MQVRLQAGGADNQSWWSFGTSLASNIVENIQLNVSNVHLRYEDATTVPGVSFAIGCQIKHLSAQSTDKSWVRLFILHHVYLGDFSIVK